MANSKVVGNNAVRVSNALHGKLKDYSDATGVPMSKVIENALDDWLKVVGSVHVEAFKGASARLAAPAEMGKVLEFQLQGVVS